MVLWLKALLMRLRKKLEEENEKKKRNILFEDSDSDEEIKTYSNKSVPAPPSVPFKSIQKKDIIEKSKRKFQNLLPKASSPSKKVCHMLF